MKTLVAMTVRCRVWISAAVLFVGLVLVALARSIDPGDAGFWESLAALLDEEELRLDCRTATLQKENASLRAAADA